MPVSVRRHNLVRLREELNLTQATFAGWIGRSVATVKAIETAALKLSPRLATLISAVTGVDRDWLLRNDLTEPMPPLTPRSGRLRKGEKTYDSTLLLLAAVFECLCNSLRLLKPSTAKTQTIELVKKLLGSVEKPEYKLEPALEVISPYTVEAAEYFASHLKEFDPELANLLNAEYLVRSVYQRAGRDEAAKYLLAKEAQAKQHFKDPGEPPGSPEKKPRSPKLRKSRSPVRKSS
jgi:DNA-binding XRE family transcriptional regulator